MLSTLLGSVAAVLVRGARTFPALRADFSGLLESRRVSVAVSALAFASACTQNTQPVTLRSLEANGRFSVLCLASRNPTAVLPGYEPRSVEDCPDTSRTDGESRSAFAMVTQTTHGEVAMVDLTNGQVVDAEPT